MYISIVKEAEIALVGSLTKAVVILVIPIPNKGLEDGGESHKYFEAPQRSMEIKVHIIFLYRLIILGCFRQER